MLAAVALAAGCTIGRGDVKGLRDADASRIRFDPAIDTSIAALNDLPSHCGPTRDHRVREEEFQVYRIIGTIRGVKRAPDHDIHIVLDDPDNPDLHVIVELPDPDSRGSVKSPYRDRLALALHMFEEPAGRNGSSSTGTSFEGSVSASPVSGSSISVIFRSAGPGAASSFIPC